MAPTLPDTSRLADWLEGRLPPAEAAQVAAQVAQADPATQQRVAWLRAFLRQSATLPLEAPPAAARDALRQRFAEQAKPSGSLLQRILAALTFDSGLAAAPAGLRSAQVSGPRQLIYGSEAADIVLDVQPSAQTARLDLLGQILPTRPLDPAPFTVQLLAAGREQAIASADERGEFTLSALPPGSYQLVLTSDQLEIVLDPLPLHL